MELHHPVTSSSFNVKCVTRNNLPKPEVKCELHVREARANDSFAFLLRVLSLDVILA